MKGKIEQKTWAQSQELLEAGFKPTITKLKNLLFLINLL
jgi:hypothetical protein